MSGREECGHRSDADARYISVPCTRNAGHLGIHANQHVQLQWSPQENQGRSGPFDRVDDE